jgi:hexokinase
MGDIHNGLLPEIRHLEELFTVDTAKLKQITAHFVEELEKGTRPWAPGLAHSC